MASSSSSSSSADNDNNESDTLDSCCPPLEPRTRGDNDETTTPAKPMRVAEIKSELDDLGVSYVDCFDRESLFGRLLEARESKSKSSSNDGDPTADRVEDMSSEDNDGIDSGDQCCPNPIVDESKSNPKSTESPSPTPTRPKFDQTETLTFLRSQRARELRTLCSEAGIRWGTIIEKEELVQLLLRHREAAASFSSSGTLAPGRVTDVDDKVLTMEINGAVATDDGGEGTDTVEVTTPLLVDVYATWCGPCQMMAPELEKVAKELGDTVRVVKMDSDKYPETSGRLRVQGLPTLILFEGGGTGKELKRLEGGMAADDLVQMVRGYM